MFRSKPSELATSIADSLRGAPQRWKHSYDQIANDSGLVMHVGSGRKYFRLQSGTGAQFHELSNADRSVIWKAYQGWLDRHFQSAVKQ